MSLNQYILDLPLAGRPMGGVVGKSTHEGRASAQPLLAKIDAAVNGGSVLSFADNVDSRRQTDILYSVQLAQRAADATCNRFIETRTWYGKFNEVLEAVGWTTEQYAFSAHDQSEGSFRMDKAALSVIAEIATGNQLQAITSSITALEKLAENDGALTLFDHYAANDLSGNFQLGAIQQSEHDALSMAMGAFYFRSTARRGKFLFFQWGSSEINFWTAAQKMTLNTGIYDKLRDNVEEKLGESSAKYLSALTIK